MGGGEEEEEERGRGNIFRKAEESKDNLNKHQDAVEKMVRTMADRPARGVGCKQHRVNGKQLCGVLQAHLLMGYMSRHSKRQCLSPLRQPHACSENRLHCRLCVMCLQEQPMHHSLFIHSQQAGTQTHTSFGYELKFTM